MSQGACGKVLEQCCGPLICPEGGAPSLYFLTALPHSTLANGLLPHCTSSLYLGERVFNADASDDLLGIQIL